MTESSGGVSAFVDVDAQGFEQAVIARSREDP